MARQPRFIIPGQPQHVIQRGNNRNITFNCDEDYKFYLEKLHDACKKYDCELHAYVLMTNHVHLLITPLTENGLSKVLQSVGRYYVQYFNFTYGRTGTLWEGRFKATLIDSESYLLICSRYIELNPVRANMVKHPSKYPWSSYHYNAIGKENSLITPHSLYKLLGRTLKKRQENYRLLFRNKITGNSLIEIREATNKAWVLGSDQFKEKMEKLTPRQIKPKARGGDRRSVQFKLHNSNRV